jgi:lipopolysaccharide biosynthesis regulator YciM
MELTLLYVLLPIAAFSGWWVGRRATDKSAESGRAAFSSDYFTGLNYLLNEQPDKAIDVFVKMLEVDSDTVETHLALGNLFRRRGEGDRAIRIHQNLIARPTLSKSQRALALFELGQDYLRAGLLGRAEALFTELLTQGEYRVEACERLLDIYQQEKDWDKAVDVARRIENLSGRRMHTLIAHFYCELGDVYWASGDARAALKMVRRALSHDRQCVRASLLQAAIEQAGDHCRAAIRTLQQVEKQDADYVPEVVGPLVACYRTQARYEVAERYLNYLLNTHGGITPLLALADLLREREGEQAASERIVAFLRERPSVRGLDRLIELQLESSTGVARENLQILQELTRRLLDEKAAYRCRQCGFKAKSLKWHCPSCREWASIRPIAGVIGE